MKKRYILLLFLAIILVIFVAIITIKSNLNKNLDQLATMTIENVDLSKVEDGNYIGTYKAFPVAAKVQVSVENHRIKNIELLEHDNGQGGAAEVIPGKVVDAQTLKVDSITGATYSSKVILKAIEEALNKGIK